MIFKDDNTICNLLIDFDNISGRKDNRSDVLTCFERIHELCDFVRHDVSAGESFVEFRMRLYGGWLDKAGGETPRAGLVRKNIEHLAGLKAGFRVNVRMAESLLCFPYKRLVGTYKNGGQKMVDQMMIHDVHKLLEAESNIYLVSDDDDFIPGLLSAGSKSQKVVWVRKRDAAANDNLLSGAKIKVLSFDF